MRPKLLVATLSALVATSGLALAQSNPPQSSRPGMRPGAGQGPTPAQMAKFQELQEVQKKLDGIRDEAMKSKALQKREEALKKKIDAAMTKIDPKAMKKMDRFETLKKEFEAARAAQDMEKAKKVAGEIQPLVTELEEARQKVMSNEKITSAIESFRDALMKQMEKVNPKTPQLLAQAESLAKDLRSGMQGPPPGLGAPGQ